MTFITSVIISNIASALPHNILKRVGTKEKFVLEKYVISPAMG